MEAESARTPFSPPRRGHTHAGPARHASIEVLPLPNHRPGPGWFTLYRLRLLGPAHTRPPQATPLYLPVGPAHFVDAAGWQPAQKRRGGLGWGAPPGSGLWAPEPSESRHRGRTIEGSERSVPGGWREGHGGARGATPVAALGAAGVVRTAGRLSRQPPRPGAGKGREGKLRWGGGTREVPARFEWGWLQRLRTPAAPKPQGQVPAVRDEHSSKGDWRLAFPPSGLGLGACGGANELLCTEAFLHTQDAAVWGEVLAQRGPAEFTDN